MRVKNYSKLLVAIALSLAMSAYATPQPRTPATDFVNGGVKPWSIKTDTLGSNGSAATTGLQATKVLSGSYQTITGARLVLHNNSGLAMQITSKPNGGHTISIVGSDGVVYGQSAGGNAGAAVVPGNVTTVTFGGDPDQAGIDNVVLVALGVPGAGTVYTSGDNNGYLFRMQLAPLLVWQLGCTGGVQTPMQVFYGSNLLTEGYFMQDATGVGRYPVSGVTTYADLLSQTHPEYASIILDGSTCPQTSGNGASLLWMGK